MLKLLFINVLLIINISFAQITISSDDVFNLIGNTDYLMQDTSMFYLMDGI